MLFVCCARCAKAETAMGLLLQDVAEDEVLDPGTVVDVVSAFCHSAFMAAVAGRQCARGNDAIQLGACSLQNVPHLANSMAHTTVAAANQGAQVALQSAYVCSSRRLTCGQRVHQGRGDHVHRF